MKLIRLGTSSLCRVRTADRDAEWSAMRTLQDPYKNRRLALPYSGERAGVRGEFASCTAFPTTPHPSPLPRVRGRGSQISRRIATRYLAMLLFGLAVILMSRPAFALIENKLPIAKRFALAKSVIIGKVTKVDAERHVVDVTLVDSLKDDLGTASFRIQFVNTPELVGSIAVDQPVVMLSNKRSSLHIADTWLLADRVASAQSPLWRTAQIDAEGGPSFPGTTASLAAILREMKAGKSTLLEAFQTKVFVEAKELAKLNVAKPMFVISADVNGDGKPDLIVGTAGGVKLFLAGADGFTDATKQWGLDGAMATCGAAGDVNGDGKIDLLLGGMLCLNDGGKFTAKPGAISLDAGKQVFWRPPWAI